MNQEEQSFSRFVEVPEAQPVKFSTLPFLIADALHDDEMAKALAAIGIEQELTAAAHSLPLLNPVTMGPETFRIGRQLQQAVMLPHDLRPLLAARGIGLRLIPHGSGPDFWTIERTSESISEQEGLHQGARDTLRKLMMQAASDGTLPVHDPQSGLIDRPHEVSDCWHLVTPDAVNIWLAERRAPYRWRVTTSEDGPLDEQPRSPEQQAEYDAARWDDAMDASLWWVLNKVPAIHAAMLLCGLNPHKQSEDEAERDTQYDDAGRKTGPGEYRRLRTVFCDMEEANPQSRTLRQWLTLARERALTYHSWIDAWLAATGKDALSAEASEPSAVLTDNVLRHTLTNGKSVPLNAEISQAKRIAINSDDASSVWAELVKLAEKGVGALIGHSSDGVQYRGAKYQATGEPDVFTLKNLRDRLKRAKARKGA